MDRIDQIQALETEPLPQRVARELTRHILAEPLTPGSTLPSAATLADRFGVSIPVVREAIRILSTRGLVEVRHGRLVRIREVDSEDTSISLFTSIIRRGGTYHDLFEMRRLLDGQLAALAAARRTEEDLAQIREQIDFIAQYMASPESGEPGFDTGFHRAVTNAAHNVALATLSETASLRPRAMLALLSRKARDVMDLPVIPWDDPKTIRLEKPARHIDIYEAIAAQDENAARTAAIAHIAASEARWAHVAPVFNQLVVSWLLR